MFHPILFLLITVSFVQVIADEEVDPEFQRNLDVKELELLNKLLSPNDTTLQHETKALLAQFLVSQALAEAEKKRQEAAGVNATSTDLPDAVATQPTTTTIAPTSRTAAPTPTTAVNTTTRPTANPEHVFNQVDKILQNVAQGNVVGIVDSSLGISAPMPVRNLVNGILTTIFCNPIDRLFNRCRPSASSPNRG